ncbi:hypothetical protein Asi02nite_76970 [Asanoa siamensis]|uniref:Uncharacterized protein n=1 Tax=Asanoa siamensis TaxID=926357 RepID=A0ABQ4D3R9_9ACTN|nr:hypothetical protein Asi02nite_76970 [Asanoa siamensis]
MAGGWGWCGQGLLGVDPASPPGRCYGWPGATGRRGQRLRDVERAIAAGCCSQVAGGVVRRSRGREKNSSADRVPLYVDDHAGRDGSGLTAVGGEVCDTCAAGFPRLTIAITAAEVEAVRASRSPDAGAGVRRGGHGSR